MTRTMHWKIARDPYLSALCAKHGEAAAYEAGFFLDDDPEDAALDDTSWLCTPRPKRAPDDDKPVVLLSTGGFCPVHAGHIAMMEQARSAAEHAGMSVIGGYLSPGHDAYLRMKCGAAAVAAHERLRLCAQAVKDCWLSVDPWEALHRRVAVNYTDVCARLEAYLRAHVHPELEVIYVCGGDNARFAYAFTERGRCIVVARPGAEPELERWRQRLQQHPHILFTQGGHAEASRDLRAAEAPALPRARLVVRLEDARAVRSLGPVQLARFQADLLALLARHAQVRSVPLAAEAPASGAISLDPMLPAAHNLAVSRLFAIGGYEELGHVPRPGAPALSQQAAQIPDGVYTLRDDDSVTGGTLRLVRALLPASVRISATELAVDHQVGEDVVDARDFLLGADEAGLVLALPNGAIGRAPYILPYVDPAARASIRASHVFSIDVWKLNARLFADTELRTGDLPEATRRTFEFLGDQRLADVCAWHVERLKRSLELAPSPTE